MTDEILRVALDTPLRRTFDYLPADNAPVVVAGQRVRVPFGRREKIGFIVSTESHSELEISKLKRISSYIDDQPTFDTALLTLLRWAADYYHHPLGEVIATAVPKLVREGAPLQERSFVWTLTAAGRAALEAGEPKRARQQRALLEHLGSDQAGIFEEALADWPRWRDHARSLRERDWVMRQERAPSAQTEEVAAANLEPTPAPTPDQQAALDTVIASGDTGYRAWLLQGITGSGKTEVYLRLAERQLRAGRRVLILVPEIGLTPQLVGRFAKRFAGYKRADLFLHRMERFEALLAQHRWPIQVIWAGKPYPQDYNAIGVFDRIVGICRRIPNCAILTGYELDLSRTLKKGADVWLNVPRLHHEASGTSGMAAAMCGAVNLALPDGWYPEFARHRINGFVIPPCDPDLPEDRQDLLDADSLLDTLEKEVLPMYYQDPDAWTGIAMQAARDILPAFDSDRLVDAYHQYLYRENPSTAGTLPEQPPATA